MSEIEPPALPSAGPSTAELVLELYAVIDKLEERYPGQKFTPDGHLVGSLGEGIAAEAFGLTLVAASNEGFDALAADGRTVQVKATQRRSISLQAKGVLPDHLIAIVLSREGKAWVAYNGPYLPVFEVAGSAGKNGQRPIGVSRLAILQEVVPSEYRLPQTGPLP